MESKKGVSKGLIISVFVIVILMISVVCGAFYIHYSKPDEIIENTLDGGNISLTYADEANLFVIENVFPTSDVVGKVYDSAELFFDFTVKVELEEANEIAYELLLIKDETVSTAINENIKIYLEKEKSGTYTKVSGPEIFEASKDDEFGSNVMSVYTHKKTSSGNDNYRLRMWLSDTAVFDANQIQNFGVKVVVRGVAK